MALSQEAYVLDVPAATTLGTPYTIDSHFFVCPLAVAQLPAVLCHCGNPVECRNIPFKLQARSADISTDRCVMPCGLADPADPSLKTSSADLLCRDDHSLAAFSQTARAHKEGRAGGARIAATRSGTCSFSTSRSPCTEKTLWYTDDATSPRNKPLVDVVSLSHCADRADSGLTCEAAETKISLRGSSGCPGAPVEQRLKPSASLNLLCCTRWKHTFTGTSRPSACTMACGSSEAGTADYNSATNEKCSASTTPKHGGIVCGLLVYEGQRFFEGRLLYEQLNRHLCWNDATWKRLHYSLTQDARSAVNAFAPAAPKAGAVEQLPREADKRRSSPRRLAKSVSGSCTSTGPSNKTLVVLHAIGSNEIQKKTCSGSCAITPSQNLHTNTFIDWEDSSKKGDVFNAEVSRSSRASCAVKWPECSAGRLNTAAGSQSRSSDRGNRGAKWPLPRTSAKADVYAINRSLSRGRERPQTTPSRGSSCSPACDYEADASGRGSRTSMPSATEEQPANAYTLSLVMVLGSAPYDIYIKLAEPIRLQPLTLAAGVAKLSTAVLLMQRVYIDEHQKMEGLYSACLEALRKTTEELAAAAAQQQKREDTLLKGAWVLLCEKKQKLKALRQRVVFLEKRLEKACATGSWTEAKQCGPSQLERWTGGEPSAEEHDAAIRYTGPMPFSRAVQNKVHDGMQTSSKTVSRLGLRAGNCRANPVLAASQRNTKPRLATLCSKRAAVAEVELPEPDVLKKGKLRHTGVVDNFLVRDKRLFPAAFACVRVKKEPFNTP